MRVAFLGDIALFGRYSARNNYLDFFSAIKDKLVSCDYVIANLETPLTNEKKTIGGRSAYLKGMPIDCDVLKYLNVTHVTLANNHIFDYCKKGLEDTIEILHTNGIQTYGIGSDYCVLSDTDNILCLRGYCCYSTNGRKIGNSKESVNSLEYDKVILDLEKDKQIGRKTILSIHWGTEHVHYPSVDQVQFAHEIAERYDVVVHGHHPHVVQGYELVDKSLIMYSLGNFCFDDVFTSKSSKPLIKLSHDNKTTFIMVLNFAQNEILNMEIVPISFDDGNHSITDAKSLNLEKLSGCFKNKPELEYNYNNEMKAYLSTHKKERDLKWYIKRLNFESIRILYYEYMCSMKYKNEFQKKVYHYETTDRKQ